MIYRLLADAVLILHFSFVVFVIFGGLLVLRRRRYAWLHLPAVIWGILIEFFWWNCPLTAMENYLRQLGGEAGYAAGFIDYLAMLVLYSPLSPNARFTFGFLLVGFNLFIYFRAYRFGKI